MNLHVRYFASVREALGLSHEVVQTTASDVAGLLAELRARGDPRPTPRHRRRHVRVAVNQVMGSSATPLQDGFEVGFFPPVTGG